MSVVRRQRGFPQGITLVELLISMLIISAIAGAGARLFVTALDSDRESRARSVAYQDAHSVLELLRRTSANLSPVRVQGIPPYSESFGEKGEGLVHRFVTRAPEGLGAFGAEAKEQEDGAAIRGVLMEFAFERGQETRLTVSRRILGNASEKPDKGVSSVLSNVLWDFGLTPLYRDGGQGPSSQETKVPSAFQVRLVYSLLGKTTLDLSVLLPVHSEAEKTEAE